MKQYDTSTVKGRLQTFLRAKRITNLEFSQLLGTASTYVNVIRKSIPEEKVMKICQIFPDLNRDWLLYGEGDMLIDDSTKPAQKEYTVPLLPVAAFAGNLQMWSKGVRLRDCAHIVSPIPNVDIAINVSGDSMEPEFHDGSTLLLRKINDRAFIPWGSPMVIDSENGVLVKCVYPGDEFSIEARSINPAYPPIQIPKSGIYGLYRVVGSIKLYPTV